MKKFTPVPRTLSNAVLKVVTGPLDPSRLISPDELKKYPPLLEPEVLFENVKIQPSSDEHEAKAFDGYKKPGELFGGESIAPKGKKLTMPKSLQDILSQEDSNGGKS